MATRYPNPTLSINWSLLVTSGDEFTLTCPAGIPIRVAATTAAEAPATDAGHTLLPTQRESWNRALAGPGYIWGRSIDSTTTIELTSWTPS